MCKTFIFKIFYPCLYNFTLPKYRQDPDRVKIFRVRIRPKKVRIRIRNPAIYLLFQLDAVVIRLWFFSFLQLGEILKAYGHFQEAALHLRHVLELRPNHLPAAIILKAEMGAPNTYLLQRHLADFYVPTLVENGAREFFVMCFWMVF